MKIEKIKIIGLFRYLNYEIDLNSGLNIIHGINGQGKTTILNILTNIFNGDFKKFYSLSFKEIIINFEQNSFIRIYRTSVDEKQLIYFDYEHDSKIIIERNVSNKNSVNACLRRFNIKPLFLPAQRVSLQEIYIEDELTYRRQRFLFERDSIEKENNFIPTTKMYDIMTIPKNIVERVRHFSMTTSRQFSNQDNLLFENFFNMILFNNENITVEKKEILKKIEAVKNEKSEYYDKYKSIFQKTDLLDKVEKSITDINNPGKEIKMFLDVYFENIKNKNNIIRKYILEYTNFEKIINSLYYGKKVNINLNGNLKNIFKIITDGGDVLEIRNLSSGEKNLLLIFYHFFFELKKNTLFMIDEPELSLHIDWQKYIVKYFLEYSKDNQIIVVTHSPDIIQNYREFVIDLAKCRFE